MKGRVSQTTQRVFPLTMICAVYRTSTPWRRRGPQAGRPASLDRRRDGEVVDAIRAILAACPFHEEGYRKIRARLAHRGLHLGGKRVLRLMREHGLRARAGTIPQSQRRAIGRGSGSSSVRSRSTSSLAPDVADASA